MQDFVKICNFSKNFCKFLSFSEFNLHYRNILSLADGLHDRISETKNGFEFFFSAKCGKFEFCIFRFVYLITNKARKIEVAESNLIMENMPSSLSLSLSLAVVWGFFPSLSRSRYLFRTLSLSLSLLFCHLLLSPHAPSIKLKLASLNRG